MDRLIDFLGLVMIYILGAWSGILTIALVKAAEKDNDFKEDTENEISEHREGESSER